MQFFRRWGHMCLAIGLLSIAVHGFAADEYKPWALRDHYSFDGENSKLMVDVQTGEWMVEVSNLGVLVKDAQCEIEYGDGRVLRLSSLKAFKDDRETFDGPLGEGTRFRSLFKAPDGLEVDFSVSRFKTRPFMMIHVNLTNKSSAPIAIREIRPAVFDRGSVAELGDSVVTQAQTRRRGNFSMVTNDAGSGLFLLTLRQPKITLGVGLLRSGMVNSIVDLRPDGKSWVGAVRCKYEPALTIQPNSRVGGDPVWMSLLVPDAVQVAEIHAWSEITGMQGLSPDAVPRGWVTVAAGATAADVIRTAEAWSGGYVRYVLVPEGWQAAPGSLSGREPGYPKDMGKLARDVMKIGMIPGISFDPLACDKGEGKLTVKAADGSYWLNLGLEEARGVAAERVDRLVNQGYQFFVVESSKIPDDVLKTFNVTRNQADLFAMQIFSMAAAGYPVVPSPNMTLGGDAGKWGAAARLTAAMQRYGVTAGPVRLQSEEIKDASRALLQAIGDYDGPVEIVGTPRKDVREAVAGACCVQEPPRRAAVQAGSRD